MRTFNIKLLYIYKFMSQCLPIYAFYTILFLERGMSVTDIAVLMALWSIFTILFEVPSGVLADRCWAIAGAFTSGTEEGLTYDNLKSDGCEEDFTNVYGKARFYANTGAILGIVTAGIIASFISVETIALISAIICFINVILALHIREKNYYSERLDKESMGFFKIFGLAFMFMAITEILLVNALQNEIKEEGRAIQNL